MVTSLGWRSDDCIVAWVTIVKDDNAKAIGWSWK